MNVREESLKKHYEWNGKIEVISRTKIESREDLSLAYTPGVAEPCLEINKDEDKWTCLWLETPVEMHYNEERIRWNTITPVLKDISYAIRPVADKKWKGKL